MSHGSNDDGKQKRNKKGKKKCTDRILGDHFISIICWIFYTFDMLLQQLLLLQYNIHDVPKYLTISNV